MGDLFALDEVKQKTHSQRLLLAAFCRLRPDIGDMIYQKSATLDVFDISNLLQSPALLKAHVDKIASTIDSDAKAIEDRKRTVERVSPPMSQPPYSRRQGTPPKMDANGRSSRTASPKPVDSEAQARYDAMEIRNRKLETQLRTEQAATLRARELSVQQASGLVEKTERPNKDCKALKKMRLNSQRRRR